MARARTPPKDRAAMISLVLLAWAAMIASAEAAPPSLEGRWQVYGATYQTTPAVYTFRGNQLRVVTTVTQGKDGRGPSHTFVDDYYYRVDDSAEPHRLVLTTIPTKDMPPVTHAEEMIFGPGTMSLKRHANWITDLRRLPDRTAQLPAPSQGVR